MTVTTTSAFSGPFAPDGVTRSFPFSFRAATAGEVQVVRRGSTYGNDQILGGYTVTLTPTGGTVLFGTAPVVGDPIYILSNPDFSQQVNFANQGSWSPTSANGAFDKAAIRDIYLKDELGRTIRSSDQMEALPAAPGRKGTIFGFNAASGLRELLSYSALASLIAAPISAILSALAKGDPGGNLMSIGLFTTAATHLGGGGFSIPVGTDLVRTSGYGSIGTGIADYVADAAVDSAYVSTHPRTSFVSNNGRGFRLDVSRGIDLFQVGGVADCAAVGAGTDNYAAFVAADAALGLSGSLYIPSGSFRSSQKIIWTAGRRIHGDGWHANPGLVNGVSYTPIAGRPGSMIVFDQDVGGMLFLPFTDNPANSVAYEYQSSSYSSLENVRLYGGGGTGTAAHGLEFRATLFVTNVAIDGFAGNGVYASGHSSGSLPWGNVDTSVLRSVHCVANKLHGFLVSGADANVLTFIGCHSQLSGGCGFLDSGFLGNTYVCCDTTSNNQSHPSSDPSAFSSAQRAYVIDESTSGGGVTEQHGWRFLSDQLAGSYVSVSQVAGHVFIGCYDESGEGTKHGLIEPALILGGGLASGTWVGDTAVNHPAPTLNGSRMNYVDTFLSRGYGFHFDDVLKINDTPVVGPRVVGAPPLATDAASAVNNINWLMNTLMGHGLISY